MNQYTPCRGEMAMVSKPSTPPWALVSREVSVAFTPASSMSAVTPL
jgi:hypothetical protein